MTEVAAELAAQTVTGRIPAAQLGTTLMHEHVLFDFSSCAQLPTTELEREIYNSSVSIERLGFLRFNPMAVRDNLSNNDEDLARDEIRFATALGVNTIVDPTNQSIGRDPEGLRRVAATTNTNIVMATGLYSELSLPRALLERSVDDLADELVSDLCEGVSGTDIRAGIIGEIGTSSPVTPREEHSLRAAARAQSRTGAPLMIHLDGWGREASRVLDVVEHEGGEIAKTVLCHMNPSWDDVDYQVGLLERGAYLEFDMFGNNHVYANPLRASPDELVAISAIAKHIARGYIDQILLSQDVYLKMMFRRYGGFGYAHILENLVPLFHDQQISGSDLVHMMTANAQRALAYLPATT